MSQWIEGERCGRSTRETNAYLAHVRDVSIGGDHLFAKKDEHVLHSVLLVRGIDLPVPLEQRGEVVEQRLKMQGWQ